MKSQERLMLQDVWRQAFRRGSLTIEFKSKAGAVRARLQLYNAVKDQKAGREVSDLELVHAAEDLEIITVDECKLRLQKRSENDMMQGIMAALGKKVEAYIDPEAQASAERILKELGMMSETKPAAAEPEAPHGDHQDNPFYGKRES